MLSAILRSRAPWTARRWRAGAAWTAIAMLLAVLPARGAEVAAPRLTAMAGGGARLDLPSGDQVALALPPGAMMDTAAELAGGGWIAAGTAGATPAGWDARELLLLTGTAGSGNPGPASNGPGRGPGAEAGAGAGAPAIQAVPPPGGRSGLLRAEPLPLIEEGRLAGLVWLEGDDRRSFAVRYAAWDGAAWSEPYSISASGPGSQLALTAARLADGSWLLAWSAFDGQDDEIVWSRGRNGSWTRPRRLTDNQVPDVTPTLAVDGRGALIAWSQLAGDGYRLQIARYLDGRWSAPVEAAAGGSLYPSFEPSAGAAGPRVLYATAQPQGWAALELDGSGRPLRRAETAAPPRSPPSPAAAGASRGLAGPGRPVLRDADAAEVRATSGMAGVIFGWPEGGVARTAAWTPWEPPAPAPAMPTMQAMPAPAPGAAPGAGGGAAGADAAGRRAPPAAGAAQVYVAFGDSITAGFGDPKGTGYPGRLEGLLTAALNAPVTVINAGFFGETTAEGVSRIGSVLQSGQTGLLLMEGTNDINARLSIDTIVQNLDIMAGRAEALGIKAFHATVIPRLPTAETDPTNLTTGTLAGAVRDLAWSRGRTLVDPFEVFFYLTPDALTKDYLGGGDKLHPNAGGYDLLARTFADVLTGADKVPPVPGLLSPFNGQQNVPAGMAIDVALYDFGAGIDLANTHLLVNDQSITVTPSGDQRKLQFHYQPPSPLAGVVSVGVKTQDLASPPNAFDGTLVKFVVAGTVFLPGDINLDGIVDGSDLIFLAYCFGAHRFDSRFRLECDLNGDGIVDGLDLAILASNFGQRSF